MKIRISHLLPAAVVGAGLLLAACGGPSQVAGSAAVAPAADAASASASPAAAASVALAQSGTLGQVLTDSSGMTLYAFTDDSAGVSTCLDKCAAAWPAFTVDGAFTAPAGFNQADFSIVGRPDGTSQLKFGKWPLYYYAGDGKAGETQGQGINGKWFALDGTATLVKESAAAGSPAGTPPTSSPATSTSAAAAPVVTAATVGQFGTVLTDAKGVSLYGFTDDANGTPTCVDKCAAAWPALLADAGTVAGPGIDQAQLTTVDRPDGGKQLKYGKWPLYYYAEDGKPGDSLGQGIGGKWFLIAADGKLVKDTAAASVPAPAPAPEAPAPAPAPAPEAPAPAQAPEAPAPANPGDGYAAAPVVGLATVGNLGEVMVGANGNTLYAFTDDTQTSTACVDECAATWPPLIVEPGFTISDELSSNGVSTLTRPDGSQQLVMGKWPLYSFNGDTAPGSAAGQGAKGKFFTVSAACKLVQTAA